MRSCRHFSREYMFFPDVKKGTLELYALINYGELRRKIGNSFDEEKSAGKLKELVQLGITKVRVRGKTFRIRTPTCPALKKINDIKGTMIIAVVNRDHVFAIGLQFKVEPLTRNIVPWSLSMSI